MTLHEELREILENIAGQHGPRMSIDTAVASITKILVKEIECMKRTDNEIWDLSHKANIGYNQAIDFVIKLLQEKI